MGFGKCCFFGEFFWFVGWIRVYGIVVFFLGFILFYIVLGVLGLGRMFGYLRFGCSLIKIKDIRFGF